MGCAFLLGGRRKGGIKEGCREKGWPPPFRKTKVTLMGGCIWHGVSSLSIILTPVDKPRKSWYFSHILVSFLPLSPPFQEHMTSGANCQTFTSSTVISYSNLGDGPKVYQETSEMRSAPGGVRRLVFSYLIPGRAPGSWFGHCLTLAAHSTSSQALIHSSQKAMTQWVVSQAK